MLKKLCLTTFSVFIAHSAMADDVLPSEKSTFAKWGEADGWTVYIDEDHHTCLAERIDGNTDVVQLGLTKDHKFGYLGVFSQNAEIKDSKEPILIAVGGREYSASATMKTKHLADGYKGGYFLADNPQFVEDVMNQYEMTVYPKDDFAFKISLDGTKMAIESAMKCNAEQM